jgi:hypothetical protein
MHPPTQARRPRLCIATRAIRSSRRSEPALLSGRAYRRGQRPLCADCQDLAANLGSIPGRGIGRPAASDGGRWLLTDRCGNRGPSLATTSGRALHLVSHRHPCSCAGSLAMRGKLASAGDCFHLSPRLGARHCFGDLGIVPPGPDRSRAFPDAPDASRRWVCSGHRRSPNRGPAYQDRLRLPFADAIPGHDSAAAFFPRSRTTSDLWYPSAVCSARTQQTTKSTVVRGGLRLPQSVRGAAGTRAVDRHTRAHAHGQLVTSLIRCLQWL